jgi:threonine/homoserine/homoserine lactone efflux protein
MDGPANLATLVATGLALGWSVAWPPGPINAEITRRGLARGFLPALAVGAGATFGDGWWAFAVALGAEALTASPAARDALAAASAALLALLGVVYLRAAWRAWRGIAGAAPPPARSRFESVAGGFLFGLTMALTSPWNLAFWLGAIGRGAALELGLAGVAAFAASVLVGAFAWVVALASLTAFMGLRASGPRWDVATRALTGLLLLWFAAATARRLLAG